MTLQFVPIGDYITRGLAMAKLQRVITSQRKHIRKLRAELATRESAASLNNETRRLNSAVQAQIQKVHEARIKIMEENGDLKTENRILREQVATYELILKTE